MTKLTEIVNSLTAEDLENLIKEAELKIKNLKAEKQVRLILVSSGFLVYKWFSLADKEKAIAYAHERFNKELEDNQKRGSFCGEISIDTQRIPESEVDSYLEVDND
ncbi:hypothetical protein RHO13_01865 [Orbus wheelerorum]|uniref:hypothetical protein n=1 Tax=Orbus wheelerorum TaxID=3074111 RepID=UPI00370DD8BC